MKRKWAKRIVMRRGHGLIELWAWSQEEAEQIVDDVFEYGLKDGE